MALPFPTHEASHKAVFDINLSPPFPALPALHSDADAVLVHKNTYDMITLRHWSLAHAGTCGAAACCMLATHTLHRLQRPDPLCAVSLLQKSDSAMVM